MTDWYTIISLFILLVGFVIGLGAVTVIDLSGFLGRKSSYWTEATTRIHKITKPLIWLGTILAIVGGFLFYRGESFPTVSLIHGLIAILLVLNGLFLSLSVSPYLLKRESEGRSAELLPANWQRKIALSLIVSDTLWWSALFLLAYYLIQR